MSEPVSLEQKRWERENDTRSHSVVSMLRVAIGQIERGEISPDHAILCMGAHAEDTNVVSTDWLQSGQFSLFAQLGLVERVKMSIIECAERS